MISITDWKILSAIRIERQYKKYPALRKEAELVNVYAEEEEKAKKVEGAKKMHKNQRIIHGLMYRNQQLFNNIMGKSPRKKE